MMCIPTARSTCSSRAAYLRLAAIVVLAGFLSVFNLNSASASSGPEQHVAKVAGRVIALANSGARGTALHKRFERLLTADVNMTTVALFSLGRYRKNLPARMKPRYLKLVKAYIAGLFVYYAGDFRGRTVEIRSVRKRGRSMIVDSRIKINGSSKKVLWRIYSRGSRHRVTDVNIRGVWLSIQMRQKFTRLLKRKNGNFDALLVFLDDYKKWMPQN